MTSDFNLFRTLLTSWLEQTSLFPGQNLHIDLILNPHAGGLRHRGRRQSLVEGLREAGKQFPARLEDRRSVQVSTWITDYPGHEKAILTHLHTADPTGPGDQRLVVIAGGGRHQPGGLDFGLDPAPGRP